MAEITREHLELAALAAGYEVVCELDALLERVSAADELKLHAAREKVLAAGGMSLAKMIEDFGNLPVPEIAGRQPVCKPCRCGPDMCADSVACPRGAA